MSSKIIIFKITDLLPVYRLSMKEWKGHCESNRQKYCPIPTLLQGCHIQNPDIQLTPRQFSRCDSSKRALFYDVKERFSSVEQQLVLYQLRYMLRKKKKKWKTRTTFHPTFRSNTKTNPFSFAHVFPALWVSRI